MREVVNHMKSKSGKSLLVIGDRVLIVPEDGDRTDTGLFLPKGAVDEMSVQNGKIVEVGPGAPIGATTPTSGDDDEPWKQPTRNGVEGHYFPMQAKVGDTAIFFRRAAVEIKFEDKTYLIVPHGAILVVIRDGKPVSHDE